MYKQVKIRTLYYEMLVEIARKKRFKPDEFVEKLIESAYNGGK